MKRFRVRTVPLRGPVMATPGKPPSSPSSPSGGGGGGGGGDDEDDGSGGAFFDAAAEEPADVEGQDASGTFAGVPLWQWLALAGAFLWTRKG